eukprot:782244_1
MVRISIDRVNIGARVIALVLIMSLYFYVAFSKQRSTLKIIEIGFGCSGTSSLNQFFGANDFLNINFALLPNEIVVKKGYLNNIKRWRGSKLVLLYDLLLLNYRTDMPLLYGIPSNIQFIGDLKLGEWGREEDRLPMVKSLHEQNQNATFIILTRPLSHWLHCVLYSFPDKNKTKGEQAPLLFDQWLFYYCNVIDYFKSVNQSERLIVFDTEKDPIDSLKNQFYKINNVELHGELPKINHHKDHPQGTGKDDESGRITLDQYCDMFIT